MHSPILDIQSWNIVIQSFCWMLVHSLWQGLVLTVLGSLVILFTRKSSPAVRYNLVTALFFSFLAACCFTFIYEFQSSSYLTTGDHEDPLNAYHPFLFYLYTPARLLTVFTNYCSTYANIIVSSWFIIFLFRFYFMIRGLGHIRKLRGSNTLSPNESWLQRVAPLASKLGITRKISLLESSLIKIPVVVGYFKPVILVPLGMLTNLPADQVASVLLHEMAHIRRGDYLVNFLQNIVENVFFFNPGLLWVSALMKEEREHCCDDLAVQHTGCKKPFLEALISFKEYAANPSRYAVAFPGRKNQLVGRFKRILTSENKRLVRSEKWFVMASLLLCAILMAVTLNRGDHQKREVKAIAAIMKSSVVLTPLVVNNSDAGTGIQKKLKPPLRTKNDKQRAPVSHEIIKRPAVIQERQDIATPPDMIDDDESSRNKLELEIAKAELHMKRAMMSKQYNEKVVQKLQQDRQLIEANKYKAYQDAEQAYINKQQAIREAASVTIQKSKFLSDAAAMKKTEAISAIIAQKNNNIQTTQ